MNRIQEWKTLLPSFRARLRNVVVMIVVILVVVIIAANNWKPERQSQQWQRAYYNLALDEINRGEAWQAMEHLNAIIADPESTPIYQYVAHRQLMRIAEKLNWSEKAIYHHREATLLSREFNYRMRTF